MRNQRYSCVTRPMSNSNATCGDDDELWPVATFFAPTAEPCCCNANREAHSCAATLASVSKNFAEPSTTTSAFKRPSVVHALQRHEHVGECAIKELGKPTAIRFKNDALSLPSSSMSSSSVDAVVDVSRAPSNFSLNRSYAST